MLVGVSFQQKETAPRAAVACITYNLVKDEKEALK